MCDDNPTSASVFRLQLATGELTSIHGKYRHPNYTHTVAGWIVLLDEELIPYNHLVVLVLGLELVLENPTRLHPSFQFRSG